MLNEVMSMEKSNPYSFYVVLTDGILEIPQDSNLSWITLFYALPKELVEKRPAYLELPRNIHQLLHSEEHRKLIESEVFLELVWDCYAWSAWQFFQVPGKGVAKRDIPGDWSNYSGDFPLWRLSYEIIKYFRQKFETEMEWSFQRLFLMDKDSELPFPQPTGVLPKPWNTGGRRGRNCAMPSLPKKSCPAVSTTAAMNGRA